jgi:hypothetical protein
MTRFMLLVAKSLATLVIGAGTLTMNLHAQSDTITVSIPFPFTVSTENIAPGTYRFSLVSSQFLLSVLNVKTGDVEMFDVRPEQEGALEQPHGHLVFRNSAGSRVLNEVHFPGTDTFSELTPRRRAGKLEAKGPVACSTVSVARR